MKNNQELKRGKMINIIISFFTIISVFLYATVLNAGGEYYFKEKNGVIIIDKPPHQDTEHKETIKYKNGEVHIGMNKEMVIMSLGEPKKTSKEIYSYGVSEWWWYDDKRVCFENGIVTRIGDRP